MKRLILIFCSILSFNWGSAQPGSPIPPTLFLIDFLSINQNNDFRFYIQKYPITDDKGEFNKSWYLSDSIEETPIGYGNETSRNTIYFHLMSSYKNRLNTHIYSIKIDKEGSNMVIYFALTGLPEVRNWFMLVIKNLKFQVGNYFLVIDYNYSSSNQSLNYNSNFQKKLLINPYEKYLDLSDIKDYKISKKELKSLLYYP